MEQAIENELAIKSQLDMEHQRLSQVENEIELERETVRSSTKKCMPRYGYSPCRQQHSEGCSERASRVCLLEIDLSKLLYARYLWSEKQHCGDYIHRLESVFQFERCHHQGDFFRQPRCWLIRRGS